MQESPHILTLVKWGSSPLLAEGPKLDPIFLIEGRPESDKILKQAFVVFHQCDRHHQARSSLQFVGLLLVINLHNEVGGEFISAAGRDSMSPGSA